MQTDSSLVLVKTRRRAAKSKVPPESTTNESLGKGNWLPSSKETNQQRTAAHFENASAIADLIGRPIKGDQYKDQISPGSVEIIRPCEHPRRHARSFEPSQLRFRSIMTCTCHRPHTIAATTKVLKPRSRPTILAAAGQWISRGFLIVIPAACSPMVRSRRIVQSEMPGSGVRVDRPRAGQELCGP